MHKTVISSPRGQCLALAVTHIELTNSTAFTGREVASKLLGFELLKTAGAPTHTMSLCEENL